MAKSVVLFLAFLFGLLFVRTAPTSGEEVLTNEHLIEMVAAGADESELREAILKAPKVEFRLFRMADFRQLVENGVSEPIIRLMMTADDAARTMPLISEKTILAYEAELNQFEAGYEVQRKILPRFPQIVLELFIEKRRMDLEILKDRAGMPGDIEN